MKIHLFVLSLAVCSCWCIIAAPRYLTNDSNGLEERYYGYSTKDLGLKNAFPIATAKIAIIAVGFNTDAYWEYFNSEIGQ